MEIRKDIRDYIVSEVAQSLNRLAIYTSFTLEHEWTNRDGKVTSYVYNSEPIQHTPVIFKKLVVSLILEMQEISESSEYGNMTEKWYGLYVKIEYRYETFNSGSNGTDIGRMRFLIAKDSEEQVFKQMPTLYVRKVSGIEL